MNSAEKVTDLREYMKYSNDIAQSLFREYDVLRKEQNRKDGFVEVDGYVFSSEEYVKYKLSQ